jgi:hypothetical protein
LDGGRLANQHDEGGLEGVLGILIVAQDAPANAPNPRGVPAHQRRKRGFVTVAEEPLQQLGIGCGIQLGSNDLITKKLNYSSDGHRSTSGDLPIRRIISFKSRF